MNQKSSDSAGRQRSSEHNALEENLPSEEQRVSENDPGRAPDNSSSTSGERSPIHNHSSNEVSVEKNDEESIEKGHGKDSVQYDNAVSLIVKNTCCINMHL